MPTAIATPVGRRNSPTAIGASAPDAPALALSNDETGTSFTASVSGSGTITLYYRQSTASSWTEGNSRTGDGDIQQTGLTRALYEVVAVAESSGLYSLPSSPAHVTVYDPDNDLVPNRGPVRAMDRLADTMSESSSWQEWCGAASAAEARHSVWLFGLDAPSPWTADTAVDIGRATHPTGSSYVFRVTSSGTTGSSEPSWGSATAEGDTVDDGTVEWTAYAIPGDPNRESDAQNANIMAARPFAVIVRPDRYGGETGQGTEASVRGSTIRVYLEASIPESYDETVENAGIWFNRKASEVLSDMIELANTAGQAAPTTLNLRETRRAAVEDRNGRGDFGYAIYEAQY